MRKLFSILVLLLAPAASAQVIPATPTLPRASVTTTMPDTTGYITQTVKASGGNYTLTQLQTAINTAAANCGSTGRIIEIDAGVTIDLQGGTHYSLPTNDCAAGKWIILRPANHASLPALGTRVTDADATNMPLVRVTTANQCGFGVNINADRYRLVGIHVKNNVSGTGSGVCVGNVGTAPSVVGDYPDGFLFDRGIIEGQDSVQSLLGIDLRCANCGIIDSLSQNFWKVGSESKALLIDGGPGPFIVENSFLEGASVNWMIGGTNLVVSGVVPSDITFRRNLSSKRNAWNPSDPSYNGAQVKNLGEFKAAKYVLMEGNILRHNWLNAQNGLGLTIKTSASAASNTWTETGHLTIRYNAIYDLQGECFSILSWENTPSWVTHHVLVHDNLCDGASNGIQLIGFGGAVAGSSCVKALRPTCPATTQEEEQLRSLYLNHNTFISTSRVHASQQGGYTALDLTAGAGAATCLLDSAFHNNVVPLAREGATSATSGGYIRCEINGVRNDGLAWSNGYDSFHKNLLTNATSSGCTTPSLDAKFMAQNEAGCATTQGSQFTSFSSGSIGAGTNNYTLLASSPGYHTSADAATRTSSGLSTDVGADIAKVAGETCGTISGTWSCYGGGAPAPTVSSITPATGVAAGGTSITDLAGTNFVSGATATLGGVACTSPVVVSAIKITCTSGAHAAATVDVVVTNPDAQSATLTSGYEYTGAPGAPTISSIVSAATGAARHTAFGDIVITINGTGFQPGATVLVGTSSCGQTVVNSTTITCVPLRVNVPGAVDVTVTNPDTQTVTSAGGFTYTKPVIGRP